MILGIVILEVVFRIALQNYWFGELGQQSRYWLALGLRTGTFAVVFVVVGTFVGGDLLALARAWPDLPPSAPWVTGFLFSMIVGYGATQFSLAFLAVTSSGTVDPVFGKDLSFYLLELPVYDGIVDLLQLVLFVTIAAWAAVGFPFLNGRRSPGAALARWCPRSPAAMALSQKRVRGDRPAR